MNGKKENGVQGDVALANGGSISYTNEVISIIAGVAANEVEGVAGMCPAGGINEKLGKNRNITRGVRVELGTEEVSVELYMVIEYSRPIQKVASEVQENVRKAVESMTGLHVVRVDVHVQGVSFEKEKKANLEAGTEQPVLREASDEQNNNVTNSPEPEVPQEQERTEETALNEEEKPEIPEEKNEDSHQEPEVEEKNQTVTDEAGE